MVKRLTHFLICGLALLVLASGCQEEPSEGTMTVPPVTQPVADPIATPTTSAEESLRLDLPATVAPGEGFYVEVHNEGQVPYIFFPPDGDSCLEIAEAGGQRLPIPQTCDVLMAVIVQPGKQSYAGDWDLKRCAGSDCLRRIPVAPGRYTVSVTLYPSDGSEMIDDEPPATLTGEFVVE